MIQSFLGLAQTTSKVFGASPTLKSRSSSTPLTSSWGGFAGHIDIYAQRNGGNYVTAPFEALYHQPSSAFRTASTFFILACVLNKASLTGAAHLTYDLVLSKKSWAETFGEYIAGSSTKPLADFGWGLLKGLGRSLYDFFKEFKDTAVEQATQRSSSLWSHADDSNTLASLRHSEACMKSNVCSEIISTIDHTSAASTYLFPGTVLLAALGASAYLYASYAAPANEENTDSPQPPSTPT